MGWLRRLFGCEGKSVDDARHVWDHIGGLYAYPIRRDMPGPGVKVCRTCGGHAVGFGQIRYGPLPKLDYHFSNTATVYVPAGERGA